MLRTDTIRHLPMVSNISENKINYYFREKIYGDFGREFGYIDFRGWATYGLAYFMGDSTYVHHISFLKEIKYTDILTLMDSISSERNFYWGNDPTYRFNSYTDSAQIFLILPIKGTDSVEVKRVHRFDDPVR